MQLKILPNSRYDLAFTVISLLLVAFAGFWCGRFYERRRAPQATVYVNRFDCSKQGAQDARELKDEILRRQGKK
jgi:hypothetical protein